MFELSITVCEESSRGEGQREGQRKKEQETRTNRARSSALVDRKDEDWSALDEKIKRISIRTHADELGSRGHSFLSELGDIDGEKTVLLILKSHPTVASVSPGVHKALRIES